MPREVRHAEQYGARMRQKSDRLTLPRERTATVVFGYRGMDLLKMLHLRHIKRQSEEW
jgi:hypothetical protein